MYDASQEALLDSCELTALTTVMGFHAMHGEYPFAAKQLDTTIVLPNLDTLDLPPSELEEYNLQMADSRSFINSWEQCKSTFDSIYFNTYGADSTDIFWERQNISASGHKKWVKEHWRLEPSANDSINLQFIGLEMKVDSLDSNGNFRTYKSNIGK
ncbi:hypothetical protein N7E81_14140 [Reichenbachiella carrageenanivorans]|uniref:Uncharacterized protein n=1 Tax=Reichenbachiella carrageenanivorans TaxID=2979869 RepID=A0ABY6D0B0_9BACT|nr:hypothetical protein [Reichenbachiella carrageenanivorans]UXX78498.1 hypothetical protein N7E81_14140 [Reichenbachiella carrageenanivorans]